MNQGPPTSELESELRVVRAQLEVAQKELGAAKFALTREREVTVGLRASRDYVLEELERMKVDRDG